MRATAVRTSAMRSALRSKASVLLADLKVCFAHGVERVDGGRLEAAVLLAPAASLLADVRAPVILEALPEQGREVLRERRLQMALPLVAVELVGDRDRLGYVFLVIACVEVVEAACDDALAVGM